MANHIRIDDGIPRGARRPPAIPNQRDETTGQMLPIVSPDERSRLICSALHQIEHGATLKSIAATIGITIEGLRLWLLDEGPEQYAAVQRKGLIARIVHADQELSTAADPLELARARETARFARWDAERRLPKLFGPKSEITTVIQPVLNIQVNVMPSVLGVDLGVSQTILSDDSK